MTIRLMRDSHGFGPWTSILAGGAVRRLPAADHPRWLSVTSGQMWLTTAGDEAHDAEDFWLARGDVLALPAGAEAVVEARGTVQFHLVEAATPALSAARASGAWARRLLRWLRRERFALQLGAVARPCVG